MFQYSSNSCIICQKRKSDHLSEAKSSGKKKLKTAALIRQENYDESYSQATQRVNRISVEDETSVVKYHKECYARFTHPTALAKLKIRTRSVSRDIINCSVESEGELIELESSIDFSKCVFCQQHSKEHLRAVEKASTLTAIVDLVDPCVQTQMSSVETLNPRYHISCYTKSKRNHLKPQQSPEPHDTAFSKLVNEIRFAGSLGKTLQLCDVWTRYEELALSENCVIRSSYVTRRATFKEKLHQEIGDIYQFYQPLDRCINERKMMLIPKLEAIKSAAESTSNVTPILEQEPGSNDTLRALVHTALYIRGEMLAKPGHTGLHISSDDASKIIPESLHLLLSIIVGGEDALERQFNDDPVPNEDSFERDDDDGDNDDEMDIEDESATYDPVCSIAQDLIFATSKQKKLTPKHIGLGLTLHQITRSRKLVTLFNRAGHCVSYQQVLKIDTALAEMTLKSVDPQNGAVTPPNFESESSKILHITADNVDIMTDTLDGRKTFHGTQMVGFQRGGQQTDDILQTIKIGTKSRLNIPDELNELLEADFAGEKPSPKFVGPLNLDWYTPSSSSSIVLETPGTLSKIKDIVFGMTRVSGYKAGWSEYNRCRTEYKPEMSVIGYMPMILHEAHDYSTLNTILHRCISVGNKLNKKHIVLTTDQALYCKLTEIRWSNKEFQDRIVLRMGGLHLAMNFLRVIGQHMCGTGLEEVWNQAGIIAEGSITKIMEGKAYAKGMRLHKLTFQALWRILTPMYEEYLKANHPDIAESYQRTQQNSYQLNEFFQEKQHLDIFNDFVSKHSDRDENFALWWTYMDLVLILLMFTRGMRAGLWNCYLPALSEMLPYIARYDHGNYFRSLAAYIADMNQLPEEVEESFKAGDFTVLRSDNYFAQVDPDHAQEWVVGICKTAGGIVGITQEKSTLQRWALSYHWRSEIAQSTCKMFGINTTSQLKEETPARRNRDNADEEALLSVFNTLELFKGSDSMCNIVTKDQATEVIRENLLSAKDQGVTLVKELVEQRLIEDINGNTSVPLSAKIPKNNAATFADLFKVKSKSDPKKLISADRDILRRLLVAYEAGRPINLRSILKHDLLPVPVAIAEMSGQLRTADKSGFSHLMTDNLKCPGFLHADRSSTNLIIDGNFILLRLGKPPEAKTFGDLSLAFNKIIAKYGGSYCRIDVIFGRFNPTSVPAGASTWKKNPVRRRIENEKVPLPKDWKIFTSLQENMEDLFNFISTQLMEFDFKDVVVVTAGGFHDRNDVKSSDGSEFVSQLKSNHVDSSTRLILHAISSPSDHVVVVTPDLPDVLILLVAHFQRITASNVWLQEATKKDKVLIPIHDLVKQLNQPEKDNILAFHAATGCKSTSYIHSITKRQAWKIFQKNPSVLAEFNANDLSERTLDRAENFIVELYKLDDSIKTSDEARFKLFGKVKKPEALPPTSDALRLHIKRAYYQAYYWMNAHMQIIEEKDPTDFGWQWQEGQLKPLLTTLDAVPESCKEIITCGCKTMCSTKLCKCSKSGILCTKLCACSGSCINQK